MKKTKILIVFCLICFLNICVSNTGLCYVRYNDVSGSHWAYEGINYASERKWLGGYSDGYFRPENNIKRAEAAKVLVAYLNLDIDNVSTSSFADVDTNQWYAPYVEAGINIIPFDANTHMFRPEEPLVREDAIFAIVRAAKLNRKVKFVDATIVDGFSDGYKVKTEFRDCLAIAIQTSLISGYSDLTLRPDAPVTRAEFVTLLYRALLINSSKDKTAVEEAASSEEHEIDYAYSMDVAHGEYEQAVLELINEIRENNGAGKLVVNNKLFEVASLKANEMSANDSLEYISPTYGSVFDMMNSAGVEVMRGSKTLIAKDKTTPQAVVEYWMGNSKKSITAKVYKEIGIGYQSNGNYWTVVLIG